MTDLPLLISSLEEATGPNYALEERLFEALMIPTEWFGSKVISHFRCESGRYGFNTEDGYRHLDCVRPPPVTASVDAALAMIGERLPGWTYTLTYWPPDAEAGFTRVTLGGPGYISDDWEHDTFEVRREGNVPAVALCLALCRALHSLHQGETHDA